MLEISYKIKGLHLNEPWFASKVPLDEASSMKLYCYRDSTVDAEVFGLKKEKKYTLINDLTQSEEQIFASFKSNVRNEIRKHEKIENFLYISDYKSKEVFLDFYKKFAEAKGLPYIQGRSIDKYGNNLFYVQGSLDGILTNMQVYLIDRESGIIRLLHSISTLYENHDKSKQAKIGWINRYLHWYTMLHFKAKSFKTFDWGGYTNDPNSPLAGIDKFKASFGGQKVKLYNYYSLPYYAMKLLQEKVIS